MAEITVSELAKTVGATVEHLLGQMLDAGIPPKSEKSHVSDEEKQQLLAHLKSEKDGGAAEPKKITLKRKTVSTLKTGSGAGKKTVNVEVRKKRTYVKRDVVEGQDDEPDDALAAPVSPIVSSGVDDVELQRQSAEHARRKVEEDERKAREQLLEEKKIAQQKPVSGKPVVSEVVVDDADAKAKSRKSGRPIDDEDDEAAKAKKKIGQKPKEKSVRAKPNKHDILSIVIEEDVIEELPIIAAPPRTKMAAIERPKKPLARMPNKHVFRKPTEKNVYEVSLPESITVADLAQKMSVKAIEVVRVLMRMGTMATINQSIDQETAAVVVEEMGHTAKLVADNAVEQALEKVLGATEGTLEARAPVVTVMGHVDHGKTSLLDYIRKAKVAAGEAGGITQHIGAYSVATDRGQITFLDTPGHAAFTAMRARGARATDIVVLVVAADDGVMPQTEEAVQHAKAAGVPLVVAINKIDKESADPDRVKNELAQRGVLPDDWGGDTQFIPVSAHSGEGIDNLLEAILLQAEMLDLKAPRDVPARGVVIESRMDKGRGAVADVLVQAGMLRHGDIVLAGTQFGRVRVMIDDKGQQVSEAGPSTPVEILGLDGVPEAGDEITVVPDDRRAREVSEYRLNRQREERQSRHQTAKLENLFANLGAGETKTLNVLVKTDVRGSLEAIVAAVSGLGNDEVMVKVVASGVGGINETDVSLAMTTGAHIIAFNVRADAVSRSLAEVEGVEIRYYSVIYQLLDEIRSALTGMLAPSYVEEVVGIAEVRDVFSSPRFGQVAGCMVIEGTVNRNKPVRVLRDNVVIFQGELNSLRRIKDDVSEVKKGIECGIGVKDYRDIKIGDLIEVYSIKQIARTL